MNKLMMTTNENLSDPKLIALKIANQAVASEYQTVISRGGSNVTSLKEAMSLLNTASSQEAYDSALKQVEKEIAINKKASANVRKSIAGKDIAGDTSKNDSSSAPKTVNFSDLK